MSSATRKTLFELGGAALMIVTGVLIALMLIAGVWLIWQVIVTIYAD